MKIYAWLYNKRCNLFLKKKSGKCAGCVPVAPLPLGKVESRLQRHLLSDSHRKRAGTTLLLFPFLRRSTAPWDFWVSLGGKLQDLFGPCGFPERRVTFAGSSLEGGEQRLMELPNPPAVEYRKHNVYVEASVTLKEKSEVEGGGMGWRLPEVRLGPH